MPSCVVSFNFKDAGYANFGNQTLKFTLKEVGADDSDSNLVIPRSSVSAKSATDGTGSITVFTSGDSDIGTSYDVTLPGNQHVELIIPAGETTADLSELLTNHQVSSTPVSVSTYDAARNRANHTGTQTLSTISDAGTIASQESDSVAITGGSVTGITDIAIADGGTGASTASAARDNLGVGASASPSFTKITQSAPGSSDGDAVSGDGTITTANADEFVYVSADGEVKASGVTIDASSVSSSSSKVPSSLAVSNELANPSGVRTALSGRQMVRSVSFNGSANKVEYDSTDDADVGTSDFTIYFWAQILDTAISGTTNQAVLAKASSSAGYGVFYDYATDKIVLELGSGASFTNFHVGSSGKADNKWHMYSLQVDRSGNCTLFVDNVSDGTVDVSSFSSTNLDNSGKFTVGNSVSVNAQDSLRLCNYVCLQKNNLGTDRSNSFFDPNYLLSGNSAAQISDTVLLDLFNSPKDDFQDRRDGVTQDTTTSGTVDYQGIYIESGLSDEDNVDIGGGSIDAVTLGTNSAVTEAQIDNINVNGNTISSTDTDGDISLTPNGTGEVNISKVDIDAGNISGTTIVCKSATITGNTDDYDVSEINILFCNTGSNSITIGGFTNGVSGQVLHLVKNVQANSLTIEHDENVAGSQDIYLYGNNPADAVIDDFGGITLVCDGTNWVEIDHK